ncbi:MAG: hypothetical protein NC429_12345 [Lachnospiraceae bacterium]|nr:hypothetical protein [Lachnospiraceae bacterium]
MVTKALLFTAFIGHMICWVCDLLLIYAPGGKFRFEYMKDNEKMSKVFDGMPLKKPLASSLLGVPAMIMFFGGYLGLYEWMKQFSMTYAVIIIASELVCAISGVAHHVFCGMVEWFYIRLGRTEEARNVVVEFFKETSVTMYICYLGQMIFAVTLFTAVVMGETSLPQWSCIFTIIPLYVVFMLLKAPGAGNLAGAVMFFSLFWLI